jgi:hypothetical protein
LEMIQLVTGGEPEQPDSSDDDQPDASDLEWE